MTQRHLSAEKWAKWPAPPDPETHASEAFREHVRNWHEDRKKRPLPVYRPALDDRMAPTIGDVRKAYRLLLTQYDDLGCLLIYAMQRIKALEARKIPEYRGVWQEGQQYEKADLVTHGGSMWHCRQATTGRPSTHHEDWQLCVKSGRDGKDLR